MGTCILCYDLPIFPRIAPSRLDDRQDCDFIHRIQRRRSATAENFDMIFPKSPIGVLTNRQSRLNHLTTSEASQPLLLPILRRPILPLLHLALICSHLIISAVIPYFLVLNLIQPMVLWLILLVCLVIQLLYLLPGMGLDAIGLVRGRPIQSAWLQSGVYLVVNTLSLLPQSLGIFLLVLSDQLPPCASPWRYSPPPFTTFKADLPGSPCHKLPIVLALCLLNAVIIVIMIVLTAWAVFWDTKQRKSNQKVAENVEVFVDGILQNTAPQAAMTMSPRWTVGLGQLLWEIETELAGKKRE